MCTCKLVLVFVILHSVLASAKKYGAKTAKPLVLGKVMKECLQSGSRFSCFSEKAAIAIERSMNWDVPLFEGVQLMRNEIKINRDGKSLTGFTRLTNAIFNFMDTHTFTVDFTDENEHEHTSRRGGGGLGGGGGGGFGGGGGLFNLDQKQLRREKKYYQYAFMVLLGIFGLTGPLVMKVLGIMAAKALLAAKAALIIVGSVALKKIFDNGKDKQSPKIKVHTVPSHDSDEHEYDRVGHNYMPFVHTNSLSAIDNHPYSAYYNDDFAPIFYGTPYNPNQSGKTR